MGKQMQAKKSKKANLLLRVLALLVTAALVLGALVLVVYRDRFNLDALKRYLAFRRLETSQTGQAAPFTHAGGDKLAMAYLDDGALFSSANGAHYYSFTGKQYAQQVLAMDRPVLSAADKAGVVYDAGGQALFLFTDQNESFDLTLDGREALLSARVNDSAWLALSAHKGGSKGVARVYDASGAQVIEINTSFVVDAALSPDCKTVAVLTMEQTAGTFQSRVLFYPVDQQLPSAQVDLGSITVLDLDYESDALWILGEDRLRLVSPDGSATYTAPFEGDYLKGCCFGGDGFALLLLGRYQAGNANRALIVSAQGEVTARMDLPGQVLAYDSAGRYLCMLTGSSLSIYTPDLRPYATLEDAQGARYAALSPSGCALLADEQQAWLYIPG
jgi:hypothetical protein